LENPGKKKRSREGGKKKESVEKRNNNNEIIKKKRKRSFSHFQHKQTGDNNNFLNLPSLPSVFFPPSLLTYSSFCPLCI
jgi:hypothetical protein